MKQLERISAQGALKGIKSGQMMRLLLVCADCHPFQEITAFGKHRFTANRRISQETAENRRNMQKTADWRLSGLCCPSSATPNLQCVCMYIYICLFMYVYVCASSFRRKKSCRSSKSMEALEARVAAVVAVLMWCLLRA